MARNHEYFHSLADLAEQDNGGSKARSCGSHRMGSHACGLQSMRVVCARRTPHLFCECAIATRFRATLLFPARLFRRRMNSNAMGRAYSNRIPVWVTDSWQSDFLCGHRQRSRRFAICIGVQTPAIGRLIQARIVGTIELVLADIAARAAIRYVFAAAFGPPGLTVESAVLGGAD